MSDIATTEPLIFRAGSTVQWKKTLADYPASEGYTLKYRLINAGAAQAVVTATPDGDKYDVEISAETTTNYTDGLYKLYGWVEKDGDVFEIYEGDCDVLPDIIGAAAGFETRSEVQQWLDNIEAAIKAYTLEPVESVEAFGRAWKRPTLEQLKSFRNYCLTELAREEDLARIAAGGTARKVLFTIPKTT